MPKISRRYAHFLYGAIQSGITSGGGVWRRELPLSSGGGVPHELAAVLADIVGTDGSNRSVCCPNHSATDAFNDTRRGVSRSRRPSSAPKQGRTLGCRSLLFRALTVDIGLDETAPAAEHDASRAAATRCRNPELGTTAQPSCSAGASARKTTSRVSNADHNRAPVKDSYSSKLAPSACATHAPGTGVSVISPDANLTGEYSSG
jgi:hypothetical protein